MQVLWPTESKLSEEYLQVCLVWEYSVFFQVFTNCRCFSQQSCEVPELQKQQPFTLCVLLLGYLLIFFATLCVIRDTLQLTSYCLIWLNRVGSNQVSVRPAHLQSISMLFGLFDLLNNRRVGVREDISAQADMLFYNHFPLYIFIICNFLFHFFIFHLVHTKNRRYLFGVKIFSTAL